MEDKKVIKLSYPILIKNKNGDVINCNEICIGRFKVKHLKLFPKDFLSKSKKGEIDIVQLIPLISGLAGLAENEVEEMDMIDLSNVIGVLESFFDNAPAIGSC